MFIVLLLVLAVIAAPITAIFAMLVCEDVSTFLRPKPLHPTKPAGMSPENKRTNLDFEMLMVAAGTFLAVAGSNLIFLATRSHIGAIAWALCAGAMPILALFLMFAFSKVSVVFSIVWNLLERIYTKFKARL